MADLEVIDAHCHVTRSKEHGIEYYTYWMLQLTMGYIPIRPNPPCYGTVAELLRQMRETGVVHTNFLNFTWSGLYYRNGLYMLSDKPSRRAKAEKELKARIIERIKENNEWALSSVRENKNLSFFCGIDPVLMNEETLIGEIADKTKRGALGVKMIPWDVGIEGNDRRWWPVYEYCQSKDIPIFTQADGHGVPGHPQFFAEVLKEFPRLKLIFAHLGMDPNFGKGADAVVVELAGKYENVYTDASQRLLDVGGGQTGKISAEDLVAHLRRIGIDRVLYGTNYPTIEYRRYMLHPVPQ